jgi:malic enzyme
MLSVVCLGMSAYQERNESLFYYVLSNNIEELLPIVHMPTVSLYCQTYGLMFKSLPRSLFISMKDKGGALALLVASIISFILWPLAFRMASTHMMC